MSRPFVGASTAARGHQMTADEMESVMLHRSYSSKGFPVLPRTSGRVGPRLVDIDVEGHLKDQGLVQPELKAATKL
jgi:hypothetical protein